ncbi:DEAD/DEAH box helicase [Metamycoplasma hyosynoviae]|uniref:DEAD/DEAH box helicase n=1 Tax=Metamycoplasma hyosynoviae TaxID=29559 RepID=UPI002359E4F2|nr:DEAD/DEAH box helicase [Metamycoplasma hyosynoviae]MDC8921526.1 DEAD/DEAH box helicase [Metamycoplasma hyosynoviae]
MKQILALDAGKVKKVDVRKVQSSKYKRLVNNLLDIKSKGDNATFYKIGNNSINCDLKKLIGIKNLRDILATSEFKIQLKNTIEKSSLDKLSLINNAKNFKIWMQENDFQITPKMEKNLALDSYKWLPYYKKRIIENNYSFVKTWKANAKKIEEIYSETNLWPLYIGTYFLKFRKDDVYLYAPFILKAVKIKIENDSIFLQNADTNIILNEKLKYLLEQHSEFKLPFLVDGEDVTLNNALFDIQDLQKSFLRNDKTDPNIFTNPFNELNKQNFENNATIELVEGTVLLQGNPSGTKLRDVMLNLITQDKIDKLIKVDDLFNYNKEAYEKSLESNNIARITSSDFSQEKAIIGSLCNSAIIIGPPGTGKSQTIANILINIAKNNKKALFISQKKVALDVVLKRLGKYQNMLFQFSESAKTSKMEKEYFYKPIIDYFNKINNSFKIQGTSEIDLGFFDKIEMNYLNSKSEIGEIFNKDLNAYQNLKKQGNLNEDLNNLVKFYKLFNKFKSKNDFLKIYKYYKKLSKRKIAKKLRISENKTIFNAYSGEFNFNFSLTKKLVSFYKRHLAKYDIYDLIQLSNFIRLNSFIQFDNQEQEYSKFLDFKSPDNTTPELLEIIYNNSALNSKKKLDNYRTLSDKKHQKLNKFFGRLERKITPPYIITSLFDDIIKQVYNIFVGTPEILGNFIDFENDKFDYVIFDEASQIFIEKAIPFISISKKVIVAGDSQQMQPTNWFATRDETDDEYTEEEITSLLDWAIHNHLPKYILEMNYRSNSSELVLFSSKEFYNSKLKGLDSFNKKNKTSIEVIDVKGVWEENRNEVECAKLIEICEKNLSRYNSIILLAFNRKQQDYICEQIALTSPKIFTVLEDKVILRNIENIQGDEADLVIASIGYTADTSLHATYIGSRKGRNALNVAITRAKDKMIIIKSIKNTEIDPKNDNLLTFKKWLNYIQLSSEKQKSYTEVLINESSKMKKSQFIFEINMWLNEQPFANDIKIKLDYCIGSYNIDMAILDKKNNFIVGLNLDSVADEINIDEFIENRIKTDFMAVKGYPIYRVSNFRFNENKPSMYKFITALLNK